MVDHMAWHEGQHIRIQRAADVKLVKRLNGARCSAANRIYRKWTRQTQAAQDRFDAEDRSWPYPEYTGPGGWFGNS
jgi:hypothetical protein